MRRQCHFRLLFLSALLPSLLQFSLPTGLESLLVMQKFIQGAFRAILMVNLRFKGALLCLQGRMMGLQYHFLGRGRDDVGVYACSDGISGMEVSAFFICHRRYIICQLTQQASIIRYNLNMHAKTISFAQVLKSKGRNAPEGQIHTQGNMQNKFKLTELVEQYEEAPKEDYTLYLGPVSRARPASFRAMASRGSNGEEIFDSWIQRQSIVSCKQNIRMISSRNIPQSVKDPKKAGTLTTERENNREPLKTVADLLRKMQNTQNGNPYFKSSNNRQTLQKQQEADSRPSLRPYKHNQQSSIGTSKQESQSYIQTIPKIAERINVQPYIEQTISIKQSRPRKQEDMDDLIAKTQNIHMEIAEMANKMIAEQEQNKQMEESLLIENTDPKQQNQPSDKENSPSFWHKDEDKGSRWASVKNQMNIYLRKIAQQREKQTASIPKIQVTPPQINISKIETEHPGYSFANRDDQIEDYSINLESIKIPQIQEVQSERLPFQNYRNYFQNTHQIDENPIPYNPSIPSTESIDLQETPKHEEETNRGEQYQISAKRIGSSLAFSSNPKDTPSPQDKQLPQENGHAVLSFTEEKPEILVKIPLNYCEAAEQFQMETVEVRNEYIETPYAENDSPSPERYKWDRIDDKALNLEVETQKNKADVSEISEEQQALKVDQKQYESESLSKVPLFIHDVIEIPKVQKGLSSFQNDKIPSSEEPIKISRKSEQKSSIFQGSFDSKPVCTDSFDISAPSEPPTQPAIGQFAMENAKSSGSKGPSKGSPSFGLKKVYSSPKTTPIISHPPIITSVFTTGIEKTRIEPIQLKDHAHLRPYERCSKIQTLAYASAYGKRAKEEPKMMIEEDGEQFKFDF